MDKGKQVRFVRELTRSIANEMIRKIREGRVPPAWDGIELREWLYEKAGESRFNMQRPRKRDYLNTVICNNL